MATFTSSLPDALLEMLDEKAKEMSLPKNKLIERALRIYLDQLNKAAYIKSYKRMADGINLLEIAEEGMSEYLNQLNEDETK